MSLGRLFFGVAILLSIAPLASASEPSVDLTDIHTIDGNALPIENQVVVFVFTKTTCPIANYYQPTLRRLNDQWGTDATLVVVHTERDRTPAEIRTHADEYDVPGAIVHDADGSLVNRLNATTTPEAVVVDRFGAIRYRGRIDDTYLGFGRRRQEPSTHDLRDAVRSVLAGQPVVPSETKAIGCVIRQRNAAAE